MKTRQKFIIGCTALSLGLLVGCTQKDPNAFQDLSGIQFQYGVNKDSQIAGAYKDFQISRNMVLAQSAPLQEQILMENDYLFAKAYQMALETQTEKKTTLQFMLPLSDKFQTVLGKQGIVASQKIEVSIEKATHPDLLAALNGRALSRADIGTSSVQYASLKRRQAEEVWNRVKGIVIRSEYAKLADHKMPLEEYLKQNVYGSDTTPTQAEINAFIKESNLTEPDLTPEVKAKLSGIVEERKRNKALELHFAKHVQKEPIYIYVTPEKLDFDFSQSVNAAWGYSDAPVHIQIFSDLNCGPCLELAKNISEIEKDFHGQLNVSFNHYFFDQDRGSRLLAESSMCALNQGKKEFRQFVEKVSAGGVFSSLVACPFT